MLALTKKYIELKAQAKELMIKGELQLYLELLREIGLIDKMVDRIS